MAITMDHLENLFKELKLKYRRKDERSAIETGFQTTHYRDKDGDDGLMVVVMLREDGEYVSIFSPMAYKIDGPHVDIFLKACMIVQWQTKLIQFEYDPDDGEIRPVIEFPLEDGTLTARQLHRCLRGLTQLVDDHDAMLRQALETGEIRRTNGSPPRDRAIAELEDLLRRLREEAGGGQGPPRSV